MKISGRRLWPPQLYSSVSWLGLLSLVNYQTCNYPVTKIPQNHVCFLSVLVLVILLWRHLLFDHKHCRVQQKLEWKVKQSFVRLMLFCIFLLIHVYSSSFLFFFLSGLAGRSLFSFPLQVNSSACSASPSLRLGWSSASFTSLWELFKSLCSSAHLFWVSALLLVKKGCTFYLPFSM